MRQLHPFHVFICFAALAATAYSAALMEDIYFHDLRHEGREPLCSKRA
jgi:hypothetical protein